MKKLLVVLSILLSQNVVAEVGDLYGQCQVDLLLQENCRVIEEGENKYYQSFGGSYNQIPLFNRPFVDDPNGSFYWYYNDQYDYEIITEDGVTSYTKYDTGETILYHDSEGTKNDYGYRDYWWDSENSHNVFVDEPFLRHATESSIETVVELDYEFEFSNVRNVDVNTLARIKEIIELKFTGEITVKDQETVSEHYKPNGEVTYEKENHITYLTNSEGGVLIIQSSITHVSNYSGFKQDNGTIGFFLDVDTLNEINADNESEETTNQQTTNNYTTIVQTTVEINQTFNNVEDPETDIVEEKVEEKVESEVIKTVTTQLTPQLTQPTDNRNFSCCYGGFGYVYNKPTDDKQEKQVETIVKEVTVYQDVPVIVPVRTSTTPNQPVVQAETKVLVQADFNTKGKVQSYSTQSGVLLTNL